ncbi:MAG: hypothetical protein OEV28_14215 [Nitrospirota bacterium]|nr:hypothetical protein [Nitrospirota bacterium]
MHIGRPIKEETYLGIDPGKFVERKKIRGCYGVVKKKAPVEEDKPIGDQIKEKYNGMMSYVVSTGVRLNI